MNDVLADRDHVLAYLKLELLHTLEVNTERISEALEIGDAESACSRMSDLENAFGCAKGIFTRMYAEEEFSAFVEELGEAFEHDKG